MKYIPLTKGFKSRVDDDVFDWVANFTWSAQSGGYAARRLPKRGKMILLHREIMGAKPGEEVDHIDGDPTNNLRENLRLCSHGENLKNQKVRKNNTSGFKGVT